MRGTSAIENVLIEKFCKNCRYWNVPFSREGEFGGDEK